MFWISWNIQDLAHSETAITKVLLQSDYDTNLERIKSQNSKGKFHFLHLNFICLISVLQLLNYMAKY